MAWRKAAEDAAEQGVDGFIIPDLPPEEAGSWRQAARPGGGGHHFPGRSHQRPGPPQDLGRLTRGFLYYVSVTGITGARTELPRELIAALEEGAPVW